MSAYLKKSIGAIVMAFAMGQPIEGVAQSTVTWFDTIQVTYDSAFDLATGIFDWSFDDYSSWDSWMWDSGSSGGGGGGGGEPTPISSPCDVLRERKPPNCPNAIAFPSGYDYGRGLYRSGSALPRLIYWIEQTSSSAAARDFALRALGHHTFDLRLPFLQVSTANERLLLSVQTACHLQHGHDQNINLLGQEISAQERDCLEILGQLQAEAGHQGFHGYFFEWLEREGIHLDDARVPETLIDWLAPSNSLRTRSEAVATESRCAQWWLDAQANQCTY